MKERCKGKEEKNFFSVGHNGSNIFMSILIAGIDSSVKFLANIAVGFSIS